MEPALLRQTFKEAIIDALRESKNDLSKPEHRGELAELLAEVFEDIGLGFAMKEVEHETPMSAEQFKRVRQASE